MEDKNQPKIFFQGKTYTNIGDIIKIMENSGKKGPPQKFKDNDQSNSNGTNGDSISTTNFTVQPDYNSDSQNVPPWKRNKLLNAIKTLSKNNNNQNPNLNNNPNPYYNKNQNPNYSQNQNQNFNQNQNYNRNFNQNFNQNQNGVQNRNYNQNQNVNQDQTYGYNYNQTGQNDQNEDLNTNNAPNGWKNQGFNSKQSQQQQNSNNFNQGLSVQNNTKKNAIFVDKDLELYQDSNDEESSENERIRLISQTQQMNLNLANNITNSNNTDGQFKSEKKVKFNLQDKNDDQDTQKMAFSFDELKKNNNETLPGSNSIPKEAQQYLNEKKIGFEKSKKSSPFVVKPFGNENQQKEAPQEIIPISSELQKNIDVAQSIREKQKKNLNNDRLMIFILKESQFKTNFQKINANSLPNYLLDELIRQLDFKEDEENGGMESDSKTTQTKSAKSKNPDEIDLSMDNNLPNDWKAMEIVPDYYPHIRALKYIKSSRNRCSVNTFFKRTFKSKGTVGKHKMARYKKWKLTKRKLLQKNIFSIDGSSPLIGKIISNQLFDPATEFRLKNEIKHNFMVNNSTYFSEMHIANSTKFLMENQTKNILQQKIEQKELDQFICTKSYINNTIRKTLKNINNNGNEIQIVNKTDPEKSIYGDADINFHESQPVENINTPRTFLDLTDANEEKLRNLQAVEFFNKNRKDKGKLSGVMNSQWKIYLYRTLGVPLKRV